MTSIDLYLGTGVVNIGLVIGLATAVVQLLKPFLDAAFTRFWGGTATEAHDASVRLFVVLVSVVGITTLQAVGPIGFHGGQDVASAVIQSLAAVLGSFGAYRLMTGPVPVTPTALFVERLVAQHESLVRSKLKQP